MNKLYRKMVGYISCLDGQDILFFMLAISMILVIIYKIKL
jgi:hypothetical protein